MSRDFNKNWQALIKPTKLDIVPGADPRRVATIVAGARWNGASG